MRTATTHESTFLTRPVGSRRRRYIIVVVVAALLALVASSALVPVAPTEAPSLSRAQQAWADRLTQLAEAQTIADIARSRRTEAARWQAMADYYRQQRANQASTDRWTGLAEHLGATGLSRARQAEAERMTGLAEYLDGTR
jgi:hypothetical protein